MRLLGLARDGRRTWKHLEKAAPAGWKADELARRRTPERIIALRTKKKDGGLKPKCIDQIGRAHV